MFDLNAIEPEYRDRAELIVALEARIALSGHQPVGNAFEDWLVDRLLDDINPIAKILETQDPGSLSPALSRIVRNELMTLEALREEVVSFVGENVLSAGAEPNSG